MRKVWIVLALAGLAGGVMMLMARDRHGGWTTDSEEALAVLEEGHQAEMKMYRVDAAALYRQALEHDPDFVAAKLGVLQNTRDRAERERLLEELKALDLGRLTARERFLVRYRLAQFAGEEEEARRTLETFLEAYPDDPWGLDAYAQEIWEDKNLEKAAEVYRKLLDADPNWVLAQNRLGYVAMALGEFDEAEELFCTYSYIAPDQANPHDSMGELLTVLGRYDEARASLERALAIKPDFCPSFDHLLEIEYLEGSPDGVEPILERAEAAGCGGNWVATERCEVQLWRDYLTGAYNAPWREEWAACRERLGLHFLIHRMAALTGRFDEAVAFETKLREEIDFERLRDAAAVKYWKGYMLHLEGVRRLAEGDVAAAVELMTKADEQFLYWGQDESTLKLFNRLNLAGAYELSGERQKAKKLLAEVARVNPPFAGYYGSLLESFSS